MKTAHIQARNCADAISKYEQMRRDLRTPLAKRQTATTSAIAPHYSVIQNVSLFLPTEWIRIFDHIEQSTCITAAEIEEGPFYIGNEFIRQDLRESQT